MMNNKKMITYIVIGGVVGAILGVLGLGIGLIFGPLGTILILPMIIVSIFTSEPLGNWTDLVRISVNGIGWAVIVGVVCYIICLTKK